MNELETALATVFFLREQTPEVRREVGDLAISRNYPKGNILYFHGDPGTLLYVVVSGQVKVALTNEDGREVILAVLRPGGVAGLVAALDSGTHLGTATTLSDTRLAAIPIARFMGWLRMQPVLYLSLVMEMAKMVRSAYEKVGEQALLPVKKRLMATLLEIAREEGHEENGGELVFIRPTHQELAERIGSTRVVVSRTLKELLEEEGIIHANGRVLRVHLTALEAAEPF
jgi:CRP-like cAMP-binding protein